MSRQTLFFFLSRISNCVYCASRWHSEVAFRAVTDEIPTWVITGTRGTWEALNIYFLFFFFVASNFVIETNCIRELRGIGLVFPCRMLRAYTRYTRGQKCFATRISASRGRYEFYCIFWVYGWRDRSTREFSCVNSACAAWDLRAPAFLTH